MKKNFKFIIFSLCVFLFGSCRSSVEITRNDTLSQYDYAYIRANGNRPTGFCENGHLTVSILSPEDVIAGYAIDYGMAVLHRIVEHIKTSTIILNYGEKRIDRIGNKIRAEVFVQCVDADDFSIVVFGKGIGFGDTESEAVRNALEICLEKIF